MRSVLALVFLSLLAVCQATLIVNKVVQEKYIVIGRNATISIFIYNHGNGDQAVKNLIVEDKTFRNKTSFAAISGRHSAKFASVEPNANVSFSFVVKPVVTGVLPDHPAIYKYQVDKDYRSGYSASLASVTILSEQDAARMESHGLQWGIYFMASLVACAVPYYLYSSADEQLNQSLKKTS
ncbi:SWI/SNF and RSC complex subunit Ssr2 [Phlyctochytrium bullatum]|nr:SWI/SNF and RSC complex subunit Ssr2 [Phlyctochytrium bullatum]